MFHTFDVFRPKELSPLQHRGGRRVECSFPGERATVVSPPRAPFVRDAYLRGLIFRSGFNLQCFVTWSMSAVLAPRARVVMCYTGVPFWIASPVAAQVLGCVVIGASTWGIQHINKIKDFIPSSGVVTALLTGAAGVVSFGETFKPPPTPRHRFFLPEHRPCRVGPRGHWLFRCVWASQRVRASAAAHVLLRHGGVHGSGVRRSGCAHLHDPAAGESASPDVTLVLLYGSVSSGCAGIRGCEDLFAVFESTR